MKTEDEKTNTEIIHFFDQNISSKLSTNNCRYDPFTKTVLSKFHNENQQQFQTPSSIIEFCGINSQGILDIKYKGDFLRDHKFSEEELTEIFETNYIETELKKKLPLEMLLSKLKEKQKNIEYYSIFGKKNIKAIIEMLEGADGMYADIIQHLYFDRMSQLNLSSLSNKWKRTYVRDFNYQILNSVNLNFSGFRLTIKAIEIIKDYLKKNPYDKSDFVSQFTRIFKIIHPYFNQICINYNKDLVDCDIIVNAAFGFDNKIVHSYTTDSRDLIFNRLYVYFSYLHFLSLNPWTSNSGIGKSIPKIDFPTQRFGKIFILNKLTGDILHTISANDVFKKFNEDTAQAIKDNLQA